MVNSGVDTNKNVYPILTDSSGRQYVIPTDGTNNILFDTDDAVIAKEQVAQVVICLNYVWDAANTQWIPMTQP